MEIHIASEKELGSAAQKLLAEFSGARTFAFRGEMGSGKTTFIKAICRELGVAETMSSPTFSLVNEYRSASGSAIYHFDFYRLESEDEAVQAGLHEYFYGGNYCFVEWPEKVPSILPEGTVDVFITVNGAERIIRVEEV